MAPHPFQHGVYQVHAKRDGAPLCDVCEKREGAEEHEQPHEAAVCSACRAKVAQ